MAQPNFSWVTAGIPQATLDAIREQGRPQVDQRHIGVTVAPTTSPLAPGTVQALDTAQPVVPQQYAQAFNPGPVNSTYNDSGIATLVDPMGNQTQVPVVSQTISVEHTSPYVFLAIGALALYIYFRKGF